MFSQHVNPNIIKARVPQKSVLDSLLCLHTEILQVLTIKNTKDDYFAVMEL